LFCRNTKPCRLLCHSRLLLCASKAQLSRLTRQLTSKLLSGNTCASRNLFCGHAHLSKLRSVRCGLLLRRQPKLSRLTS
jgi:hypothetical protein